MIVLYIFLALIALLLFLLFVNLHVIFRYGKNATVTVRVLFIRLDGMKLYRRFSGKKEKGQASVADTNKGQQTKKRKFDPIGFTEFLVHITKVIGLAVKEHLSNMKINLKELYVSIGTDDAAKTALIYGGAIQAANGLCALLRRFSRFRCDNRRLVICPNFTEEKSRFSIHLDLCVKPVHLIAVLLRAYFRFFEGKEVKNERNTIETSHRRVS